MTPESQHPLVPPYVDLTDFPFVPVMIARLKQSRAWLLCKRKPELAFYMINLWTAAWHARPSASLENDDFVLSDIAMCPAKAWKAIKDDALRGWIVCSDGRLYHPVIAEYALSAWSKKVAQRKLSAVANARRHKYEADVRVFDQQIEEAKTLLQVLVTNAKSLKKTSPRAPADVPSASRRDDAVFSHEAPHGSQPGSHRGPTEVPRERESEVFPSRKGSSQDLEDSNTPEQANGQTWAHDQFGEILDVA